MKMTMQMTPRSYHVRLGCMVPYINTGQLAEFSVATRKFGGVKIGYIDHVPSCLVWGIVPSA